MTENTRTADPGARALPLAAGGELELKLGSNRLRIRTTDGNQVVIRGRTDHDLERDVEITSGTGWIRVTDGPAGSFRVGPITVRNGGHTPDLDIEVPRNVRISGRTISGDIEAVGIASPSRWQSASGTVRIGAESGPVTIETMSGDAVVDARGTLAVTARTVSGSVRIRAPRVSVLDVATTSGDVTVDAALDEHASHTITSVSGDVRLITGSEVTVDLQSVAGDIRASMPHRVDGARGRRTVVVGSGRVRVLVRTMSGDVRLKPGVPDVAPTAGETLGEAPRGTFWADFGRDWAESAKDWASWGTSWAAGRTWGSPADPRPGAAPAPAPPTLPTTPTPTPTPPLPAPAAAAPATRAGTDPVVDPTLASAAAPSSGPSSDPDDTAPVPDLTYVDIETARLEILRSLERGELNVEAAADRLAALDGVAAPPEA